MEPDGAEPLDDCVLKASGLKDAIEEALAPSPGDAAEERAAEVAAQPEAASETAAPAARAAAVLPPPEEALGQRLALLGPGVGRADEASALEEARDASNGPEGSAASAAPRESHRDSLSSGGSVVEASGGSAAEASGGSAVERPIVPTLSFDGDGDAVAVARAVTEPTAPTAPAPSPACEDLISRELLNELCDDVEDWQPSQGDLQPPLAGFETPSTGRSESGEPPAHVMQGTWSNHAHDHSEDAWVPRALNVSNASNMSNLINLSESYGAACSVEDKVQLAQMKAQHQFQERALAQEMGDVRARLQRLDIERAQAIAITGAERRTLMTQVTKYQSLLEYHGLSTEYDPFSAEQYDEPADGAWDWDEKWDWDDKGGNYYTGYRGGKAGKDGKGENGSKGKYGKDGTDGKAGKGGKDGKSEKGRTSDSWKWDRWHGDKGQGSYESKGGGRCSGKGGYNGDSQLKSSLAQKMQKLDQLLQESSKSLGLYREPEWRGSSWTLPGAPASSEPAGSCGGVLAARYDSVGEVTDWLPWGGAPSKPSGDASAGSGAASWFSRGGSAGGANGEGSIVSTLREMFPQVSIQESSQDEVTGPSDESGRERKAREEKGGGNGEYLDSTMQKLKGLLQESGSQRRGADPRHGDKGGSPEGGSAQGGREVAGSDGRGSIVTTLREMFPQVSIREVAEPYGDEEAGAGGTSTAGAGRAWPPRQPRARPVAAATEGASKARGHVRGSASGGGGAPSRSRGGSAEEDASVNPEDVQDDDKHAEDMVSFRPHVRDSEEEYWTAQRVDQAASRGFEARRRSGSQSWDIKLAMGGKRDPPMSEVGMQRYCRWLSLRLESFCKEQGVSREELKSCRSMVDFSHSGINDQMVWMLLEALVHLDCSTVLLKLFSNSVTQGGVLALCEFIRTSTHREPLHELHLSHNEVDDDSVLELLRTMHLKRPRYPPRQPGGDKREEAAVPVWLQLNHNRVVDPARVLQDARSEGIILCEAKDRYACGTGRCSQAQSPEGCPLVHLYKFFDQDKERGGDDRRESRGKGGGKDGGKGGGHRHRHATWD